MATNVTRKTIVGASGAARDVKEHSASHQNVESEMHPIDSALLRNATSLERVPPLGEFLHTDHPACPRVSLTTELTDDCCRHPGLWLWVPVASCTPHRVGNT